MQRRLTSLTSFGKTARRLGVAGLLALAIVVLPTARQARAEFFQFATTVTILNGFLPPTSTVAGQNTATATLTTPAPNLVAIALQGAASNSPGDNVDGTTTGSDIVFANIAVTNLKNTTLLENVSIPYTFHIVVSDYPTFNSVGAIASASFDITGLMTGTVGKLGGGKQVNISTNTLDAGNVLMKTIGTEIYTLSSFTYVPPGPFNPGAFGVHVTARLVPEPSTVALLGIGLLALATPAWRRLRRKS
jgi:hypothetical protein